MLAELSLAVMQPALTRMVHQIELVATRSRTNDDHRRDQHFLAQRASDTTFLKATVELPKKMAMDDVNACLASAQAQAISFEILAIIFTAGPDLHLGRLKGQWIGLFLTSIRASNEDVAAQIFDSLVEKYRITIGVVERDIPDVFAELQHEAQYKRLHCILEAIANR